MKKFYLLGLMGIGLLASCSSDEAFGEQEIKCGVTISADFERNVDTRSTVGSNNELLWAAGDAISAYVEGTGFAEFTLSYGAGTSSAEFTNTELAQGTTISGYAVYPSGIHSYTDGSLTVNLPAEYGDTNTDYSPNTNAIMLAAVTDGEAVSFKHLGAVLCVPVNAIPSMANGIRLTTDMGITGNFTPSTVDGVTTIATTSATADNKSVTIRFKAGTADSNGNFYFPLPTGTYGSITLSWLVDDYEAVIRTSAKTRTIERTNLVTMADLEVNATQEQLLCAALADATTTEFTLTDDIDLSSNQLVVKKNFTLNMGGRTITSDFSSVTGNVHTATFTIMKGAALTVTGNGTINTQASNGESSSDNKVSAMFNNCGGTLIIENGTFNFTAGTKAGGWYMPAIIDNNPSSGNATVEIKGGKFTVATSVNYAYILRNFNHGTNTVAMATIEAGEFSATEGYQTCIGNWDQAPNNTLVVNGGEYENIYFYNDDTTTENQTISINGGTFDNSTAKGFLTDNSKAIITLADGVVYHAENKEYKISTKDGLNWVATQTNEKGKTFVNELVTLQNDITFADDDTWIPIGGANMSSYQGLSFYGTFDGGGYTISGINVSTTGINACAGLFGTVYGGTVKNVTVADADIVSEHYAGGIVAYSAASTTAISNCHVKNSNITAKIFTKEDNSYDNGDKAGGIAGYIGANNSIESCTVETTTIKGYRDLGGIAGYSSGVVKNCTIKENVKIVIDYNDGENYKNYSSQAAHLAGSIVGREESGISTENNTGTVAIECDKYTAAAE